MTKDFTYATPTPIFDGDTANVIGYEALVHNFGESRYKKTFLHYDDAEAWSIKESKRLNDFYNNLGE